MKGNIFIALYVGDNLMIGDQVAIDETIGQLKKNDLGQKQLNKYFSCNIVFDKKKNKAFISQSNLMKNVDEKFGDMVKDHKKLQTPGTPNLSIV